MSKTIAKPPTPFLEEAAIRGGMDLLMFGHRSHLQRADDALAERGLGRAHHRLLYLVSRQPGQPVTVYLHLLGITKQSLGRVLGDVMRKQLIQQRVGERDRRQRLIYLTEEGAALERGLFHQLHANMARAYEAAGAEHVHGYWAVMQHLMSDQAHGQFLAFNRVEQPSA